MKSRFIKVKCNGCNNEQNIFGKAAMQVACLVCGEKLSHATGGKSKICGKVLEVIE